MWKNLFTEGNHIQLTTWHTTPLQPSLMCLLTTQCYQSLCRSPNIQQPHEPQSKCFIKSKTGYRAHDDVPSLFDAVQFFLCGLKPSPLWRLEPQDVLQEEISMLIFSPKMNLMCLTEQSLFGALERAKPHHKE